jgi:hypothetical protein
MISSCPTLWNGRNRSRVHATAWSLRLVCGAQRITYRHRFVVGGSHGTARVRPGRFRCSRPAHHHSSSSAGLAPAAYYGIVGACGRAGAITAAAAGWAVLMTAGCAGGPPPAPVLSGHATTEASPIAGLVAGSARRALAARYLAVATAGNRRLEADFDRLNGPDRADLAAARTDLRDAAATESLFDQRLARIAFPAETEMIARLLVMSNQIRSGLTAAAAGSVSLSRLHASERQLAAANGPVEDAVIVLRSRLGLPPPDTS